MPKVTDLESLFEEDKKFIISKDYDGYIQNYRNTFECKGSQNHHIVPKYTWGVGDDKIYDSDDYKIYLPCIKHACAHYIRYLKEGNHKDLKACLIILHEQNASYYTEKELRFKSWLSNFVSNNSVSRFKSWLNCFIIQKNTPRFTFWLRHFVNGRSIPIFKRWLYNFIRAKSDSNFKKWLKNFADNKTRSPFKKWLQNFKHCRTKPIFKKWLHNFVHNNIQKQLRKTNKGKCHAI